MANPNASPQHWHTDTYYVSRYVKRISGTRLTIFILPGRATLGSTSRWLMCLVGNDWKWMLEWHESWIMLPSQNTTDTPMFFYFPLTLEILFTYSHSLYSHALKGTSLISRRGSWRRCRRSTWKVSRWVTAAGGAMPTGEKEEGRMYKPIVVRTAAEAMPTGASPPCYILECGCYIYDILMLKF